MTRYQKVSSAILALGTVIVGVVLAVASYQDDGLMTTLGRFGGALTAIGLISLAVATSEAWGKEG